MLIGTSWRPAFCAANHLLSPATISYGSLLSDLFFLTAIGCIMPFFFIDEASSLSLAWSKIVLG